MSNNIEKLFLLQEWLKHSQLKKVYLGIDYYNFHKNLQQNHLTKESFFMKTNYFSIATLKLSYKTVKNTFLNKPQNIIHNDGSIEYLNKEALIKDNRYDFSKKRFRNEAYRTIQTLFVEKPFTLDKTSFKILQKIKFLSDKNNIKLYAFITPIQYEGFKIIQKNIILRNQFTEINQRLTQIFGKIYNFYRDNPLNRDMRNFYDPYHYRKKIAKKIVEKLNKKGNYGIIETNRQKESTLYE